jgi:hypothetical protein
MHPPQHPGAPVGAVCIARPRLPDPGEAGRVVAAAAQIGAGRRALHPAVIVVGGVGAVGAVGGAPARPAATVG